MHSPRSKRRKSVVGSTSASAQKCGLTALELQIGFTDDETRMTMRYLTHIMAGPMNTRRPFRPSDQQQIFESQQADLEMVTENL